MENKKEHKSSASSNTVQNSKSDENSIMRLEFVFEQINGWIRNADNKVSISCGIFTGVFGIVTFLAEHFNTIPDNHSVNEIWRYFYIICVVLSIVGMAVAVILYALAIIPNIKSSGNKMQKKKYPIYYGDIASLKLEHYRELMLKGTNKDFTEEIIQETWHNSGVCTRKMKFYKVGVIMSIIAIMLSFASWGAHFMMFR